MNFLERFGSYRRIVTMRYVHVRVRFEYIDIKEVCGRNRTSEVNFLHGEKSDEMTEFITVIIASLIAVT